MHWYLYLAYFFGGAFLANSLPHLGNGISGRSFQSPFASPPGVGLSSPTINVLWGFLNLVVAYLLICRVGSFNMLDALQMLVAGAGFLAMSLMLARAFGRFYSGD
jgi:UDP-N-acetylmuramyl pentapeptide phosphotransferase/UDP-N-acetylglucosamine-1-phosphate transferase